MVICNTSLLFAETNAVVEVKLFKNWIVKGERNFCNVAIKNTGTVPLLLAKDVFEFYTGQLSIRSLDNKQGSPVAGIISYDQAYEEIEEWGKGFEPLPIGETRVFEGRKFRLPIRMPFSEMIQYKVSVYLGKGVWLDSEPLTVNGVVPDAEEHMATITDVNGSRDLVAVTYKNERWLYLKTTSYWSICPISLTNKIRVEPHDGERLHKIWDGDKSMIYRDGQMILLEGPDENDVFGKWTRERKQRAEADNAEVRRKKAEVQAQ